MEAQSGATQKKKPEGDWDGDSMKKTQRKKHGRETKHDSISLTARKLRHRLN